MAHLGGTFGCSVASHLQRVGKVLLDSEGGRDEGSDT